MYKLVASDLDETLLRIKDKSVSEKNRQAIARAREKGVKFVVATGRPFYTVTKTLEELGLKEQKEEYSICLNGAMVVEHFSKKPLFCIGIDFETINALFEKGLQYDVAMHIYTDDETYGYNMNDDERNYIRNRLPLEEFEQPDLSFLKDRVLTKILFENPDQTYLKQIAKDLEDLCTDLEVSYSSNRYLEFNKKGVSKGSALHKLAEILGLKQEELIAVGDNCNDLSMIQAAALGIGVANVNPEIADLCDVILNSTCDQDAMAEVMERFVL